MEFVNNEIVVKYPMIFYHALRHALVDFWYIQTGKRLGSHLDDHFQNDHFFRGRRQITYLNRIICGLPLVSTYLSIYLSRKLVARVITCNSKKISMQTQSDQCLLKTILNLLSEKDIDYVFTWDFTISKARQLFDWHLIYILKQIILIITCPLWYTGLTII